MAFKRKSISSQKTVGARLRSARRRQKITLEEAEEKTKVRLKYLKAIEEDNWQEFPSQIYLLGFVRRYAGFLGLDQDALAKEFKHEIGDANGASRGLLSRPKDTFFDRFIITPRVVVGTLVVVILVALISYVIYSVNQLSKPPFINIVSPKEEIIIQKEIVVSGKTEDTALVEINGQSVNVDDAGDFSQKVELTPGVNIFEIKAKSRLGRSSAKTVRVLFENK